MNFIRKKACFIGLLSLLLLFGFAVRVYEINQRFAGPMVCVTEADEVLSFENLEYRLADWHLLTQQEFLEKKEEIYPNCVYNLDDDIWCFVYVEFEINNPTDSDQSLPMILSLDCNAYGNNAYPLGEDGMEISEVRAGENRKVHFLFILRNDFLEDVDPDAAKIIFMRGKVQYEMKLQ